MPPPAQFTTNEAGLTGVAHVADAPPGGAKDYSSVIASALAEGGFDAGNIPELEPGHPGEYTVGFGYKVGRFDARCSVLERAFLMLGGCQLLDRRPAARARARPATAAPRPLPTPPLPPTCAARPRRPLRRRRQAILGVAGAVVDAAKSGKLEHVFLIVRAALGGG